MLFNVYHMRNYYQFAETEDCVDQVLGVPAEGIEAAVKKLFAHSWLTEYDWIEILLDDDKQEFDDYLAEKDSQALFSPLGSKLDSEEQGDGN